GQLVPVDDDLLDRVVERRAALLEHLGQDVHDLVEPAAVRTSARSGHRHGPHQATVAGGVTRAADAEHAGPHVDDVEGAPTAEAGGRHVRRTRLEYRLAGL